MAALMLNCCAKSSSLLLNVFCKCGKFSRMQYADSIIRGLAASSVNEIQSFFTTVNKGKIHCEKVGNGSHNILLLPGALGSAKTDFTPQMNGLDRNAFTIYAWDPSGYGKSRPPNRTWPSDYFQRDADDAAALLKALGLKRTSLVGWSDGGITALVLAVNYPHLVNKLVVFGANAYVTPKDVELYEAIRDIDKWSARMREPFEEVYGVEDFKCLWNEWIDAISNYLTVNKGDIVRNKVHEIQHPTLIIHGEKDPMVPREHPDFLTSQIKNSILVSWPDAKHNLHLRFPEAFNKLVTEFLTKT